MDRYVAADAFSAGLESQPAVWHGGLSMKACVALQTELAAFAAHQEHPVGAPVRVMARNAAFDAHSRVLINVRTALFHVAIDAHLLAGFIEARGVQASVWIVAIRAL